MVEYLGVASTVGIDAGRDLVSQLRFQGTLYDFIGEVLGICDSDVIGGDWGHVLRDRTSCGDI